MDHLKPLTVLLAVLLPAVAVGAEEMTLPQARGLELTIGEAFRLRCSTRSFDPSRPIRREQLGTLLWSIAGVNRPDTKEPRGGKRTVPSAFGADAVDVFVTSRDGTFRYDPAKHALVRHSPAGDRDLRSQLTTADWAKKAPLLVALVVDYDRYPDRVSPERRAHYAHADAAVIGQNLYLACAALRLGTVMTASAPREASKILGVGEKQRVVFVMPVGYPE